MRGGTRPGRAGVIKRITDRVNPRVFRVVALPAPSEREKTLTYMQRYITHFPAAGEIVLFVRSWYNRAGVERIMGFCSRSDTDKFLRACPEFERYVVSSGIIFVKYRFDVGMEEQERRLRDRINDPRKIWRLSPMDLESYRRWYQYSLARDEMLVSTDTEHATWYIVPSDDTKRARLSCITHLLGLIPYRDVTPKKARLVRRNTDYTCDDRVSLEGRRFIPARY